jgi:membrane-anchored protein YejM (alkaline phosphatase superfamily)
VLLLLLVASAAHAADPHVVLIGIDGCRVDALDAARAPHLARLRREGAYALDVAVRAGPERVLSGPGWATMLTGVWAAKHGVVDNTMFGARLDRWSDVFGRVRAARPDAWTASLASWPQINAVLATRAHQAIVPAEEPADWVASDRHATRAALHLIDERQPALLFVYFLQVDMEGHTSGFDVKNPAYIAALERVDAAIGRLRKAVDARRRRGERWALVVSTDHGGALKHHDYDPPLPPGVDRSFLIVHGDGVRPGPIAPPVGLVDVVPTVLRLLDVPVDPKWELDGRAVTASSGRRR